MKQQKGPSIFDSATVGSPLWSETVSAVTVTGGINNVLLGGANPITPNALPAPGAYLEVTVTQGSTSEVLSPRTRLTSVPFALQAEGTLPPSALILGATPDDPAFLNSGFKMTGDTVSGYYLYGKMEVDKTPPVIQIIEPLAFSGHAVSTVAAEVQYGDSLSGVDVGSLAAWLNGETVSADFITGPDAATASLSGRNGLNILQVNVSDLAGNGNQAMVWFYVDTLLTPPEVALTSPWPDSTITTNTPLIRFELSDAEGGLDLTTLSVLVNGVDMARKFNIANEGDLTVAYWSVPFAFSLPEGINTFSASIYNYVGSLGSVAAQATISNLGAGCTVDSVAMDFGFPGDTVGILGHGFSGMISENVVTFAGGLPATVAVAAPTLLTVTVPDGARSGEVAVNVNGHVCATPRTFTIGLPYGFVANNDNPNFSNGGPKLTVIDFDDATPGTPLRNLSYTAGAKPYDAVLSADGRTLYVTDEALHQVLIYDAVKAARGKAGALLKTITLPGNPSPHFLALSPDGLELFVGCANGWLYTIKNHALIVNPLYPRYAQNLTYNIWEMAVSPTKQRLYLAKSAGSSVPGQTTVLDLNKTSTNYLLPTNVTGTNYRHPIGVTVKPDQSEVYIFNNNSNGVTDLYSFSIFAANGLAFTRTQGAQVDPNNDVHDVGRPRHGVFDPLGRLFYATFAGIGAPSTYTNNMGVQKWRANSAAYHAATITETTATNDNPRGVSVSPGGKWIFYACYGAGSVGRNKLRILNHALVKSAIDGDLADPRYNLTYDTTWPANVVESLDDIIPLFPGIIKGASGFDGPINLGFQEFPVFELSPSIIHLAMGGVALNENLAKVRVHPVYGDAVRIGLSNGSSVDVPGDNVNASFTRQWLGPGRQIYTLTTQNGQATLAPSIAGVGKLIATREGYPSNLAFVTVPPQELVQTLFAEACRELSGDSTDIVHRALASVIKNRLRLTEYCFDNPNIPGKTCLKYGFPHDDQIKADDVTEEIVVTQVRATITKLQYDSVGNSTYISALNRSTVPTLEKGSYDSSVLVAGDATLDLLRTLTVGVNDADTMWDLTSRDMNPSDPKFNDPNYQDIFTDRTGGSFGFFSPSNVHWGNTLSSDTLMGTLWSEDTTFPSAGDFEGIVCRMFPKFCVEIEENTRARYLQVVIISDMPRNVCVGSKNQAPQFIFIRWRDNNEPAVIKDP